MKDTDLKAIFKKVVVDEITKKQEGLTRFINQMRYQITKAEEKWANLYYDFLRGIFSAVEFEILTILEQFSITYLRSKSRTLGRS